jgi:hypothetical protein
MNDAVARTRPSRSRNALSRIFREKHGGIAVLLHSPRLVAAVTELGLLPPQLSHQFMPFLECVG